MYTFEKYSHTYTTAQKNPEKFWGELAEQTLDWFEPWSSVYQGQKNGLNGRWFVGAKCNISHNCLDRHVIQGNGERIAIKYLREDGHLEEYSYTQLLEKVQQCSQALQKLGVQKGDRVLTYLPHCPEQAVVMLACARLGALHSVVYAGFSADALATRITSCQPKVVITTQFTVRNQKHIPLLDVVEKSLDIISDAPRVMVVNRAASKLDKKYLDFHELLTVETPKIAPVPVEATHPLFILYTSGTTGTPKGIVHSHGGYNLYTHVTTQASFNLEAGDVFWCAADTGWITGHSYGVYGPLSLGVTSLMYEGSPVFPNPETWWQIIETHQVKAFYTSPTAIRMLMKESPHGPSQYQLDSLRVIGSVGEPINPSAWEWYKSEVGSGSAEVVDTWWQTETGGHLLVTLPSITQKPGKAGLPFFGIEPHIQTNDADTNGKLFIRRPWPGMLMDCWQDAARYQKYFSEAGFATGDVATQDEDGYIQVLGRDDDVLNISGVRLGSAEVENALVSHPAVVEAAVVALPDELTGSYIKAFVVLASDQKLADPLQQLRSHVGTVLTHVARPKEVTIVESLPKTRSGKIMRRLLRARELGVELADTSTLDE